MTLFPQLTTLRGAILEDAVPSTARHGTTRGLPLKEVLEYVIPELNIPCLRLALNSPKVAEQLLKLDEHGVSTGGGWLLGRRLPGRWLPGRWLSAATLVRTACLGGLVLKF